jgi:hypothetical protein
MFIPEILKESKRNMSFRDKKELVHGFKCINTVNGVAVIDCRIYAGKNRNSSQIYAIVWIDDQKGNRFSYGVGIAGGYGYHKGSYAIESALIDMGIKLDQSIHGRGYDACIAVFASIMKDLGYPSFIPVEFSA